MRGHKRRRKLPVNLLLEIKQYPPPNDIWYDVTGIISWEPAGYMQRMDTGMCNVDELPSLKDAIKFFVGRAFKIKSVTEQEGETL